MNSNIKELSKIIHSSSSPWVYPWQDDTIIADERINFRFISGIDEHVEFLAGGWPEEAVQDDSSIKVAVPALMAEAYALSVGDKLPLSKTSKDLEPTSLIEVSGIFIPKNAGDTYWLIEQNPFRTENNPRYIAEYGVFVQEKDYYTTMDWVFPGSNLQLVWLGIIDPSRVSISRTDNLISGIEAIRDEIASYDRKVVMDTNLDQYLDSYAAQTAEIIPPIYLLVGEVLFLGLYYVVMVAALSIRQVEGELSILASRGAGINQLLKIQIFDALLICIVALICGPVLAYGLITSLGIIGPLADINQIDWVANIPAASWLAAMVSVFACFTALIIPAVPILRRSVIQHQRGLARRNRKPWWHRYYLDVIVLILGLIALWRLSIYGSISGINLGDVDWLLLFAPLALLIGSATVLLRIFPLIFSVISNLLARGRGLTAVMAFWHTSRDPTHITRLILLFTLAMALGILSTGLNATLTLSERERARHSTGGEVRLSFDNFIPMSAVEPRKSITHSSAAWRGVGRANVRSYRNIPNFSILAIEPFSFATVSQYRIDYTDDYIGFVLGQLVVDPAQLSVSMILVPGTPTHIGLWIADPYPARTNVGLLDYTDVRTKLQSSEGEIIILDLELDSARNSQKTLNQVSPEKETMKEKWFQFLTVIYRNHDGENISDPGNIIQKPVWRYYEAKIPEFAEQGYPLYLHSLWIKIRRFPAEEGDHATSSGPLILDDIYARDTQNNIFSIEDFEEISTIWQTNDNLTTASYTKSDITHSGEASMRIFLGPDTTPPWMVLSPAQTIRNNLIPALASPKFLEMTGLNIGDKFSAFINSQSLILDIKNSVNYFPTMYDREDGGYVILSREALLSELNRNSRIPVNYNELWFTVDDNEGNKGFQESIPQIKREWSIETEGLLFKSDPLTLGLRSVVFLGYSLTFILSLVGFATYMFLSARKRASSYGILRSLGLSTTQLYSSLVIEQLILILSGIFLGVILGSLINQIVLPGLPISFADMPAIPPFIPKDDWYSVFRLIFIIIGGFLFTLAVGTFLLWRLKLHQVLRVGEE